MVDSKFDPAVEVPPFEAKGVIASTPEHLRLLPTLPDVVLQPLDPLDLGVSVPQRREEREARDGRDRDRERRERHERDRDRDREKDSLAPRGSRRGRPSKSPKRSSESLAELQVRKRDNRSLFLTRLLLRETIAPLLLTGRSYASQSWRPNCRACSERPKPHPPSACRSLTTCFSSSSSSSSSIKSHSTTISS